jgi:hypothetical protein
MYEVEHLEALGAKIITSNDYNKMTILREREEARERIYNRICKYGIKELTLDEEQELLYLKLKYNI